MVDCTGLENRQRATFREFESHSLRQNTAQTRSAEGIAGFFIHLPAFFLQAGHESRLRANIHQKRFLITGQIDRQSRQKILLLLPTPNPT